MLMGDDMRSFSERCHSTLKSLWPMLALLCAGGGLVIALMLSSQNATSSSSLEAASLAVGLYGYALSILLPCAALCLMPFISRKQPLSFVPYTAVTFLTALPAYALTCIIPSTSIVALLGPFQLATSQVQYLAFVGSATGIYCVAFVVAAAVSYPFATKPRAAG